MMKHHPRLPRWVACGALACLALTAGCEDEFLTGSSINRMRLLGARVVVDGEPERAWLRPGDNGRVGFSLVFGQFEADDPRRANPDDPNDPAFPRDRMRDVRSMILSCTKGDIGSGQPQCAEVLFLAELYQRYQNGELADAGVPDGGAPPPPPISQEEIDATFEALRRGVGCDDNGSDGGIDYFGNASLGIRSVLVTTQPAQLECVNRAPGVAYQLADDYAANVPGLAARPERLVQGVVCEYGEPIFKLTPPFFGCEYEVGSDPNLPNRAPIAEVFFYTVGVEHDGLTNRHPAFAATPLQIADANPAVTTPAFVDWDTADTVPADCAGVTVDSGVIIKDFGDKSSIRIEIEATRELVSTSSDRREVYQVESFTAVGELDRQYSVIDDEDSEPVAQVEWEHGARPRDAAGDLIGGQRADFHFLIRDGRGGFVIETRSLCLCAGGACPPAQTAP